MSNANDKELTVFGFSKGMRAGLVTFIMAIEAIGLVYLFFAYQKSEADNRKNQQRIYEQMIDYMKPARDQMYNAASKVDTAATRAIAASDKVDSVSTYIMQKKQKK
ncbi:hypothetical protein [Pedobacter antarcticus]|uniref:hypothetical protein n=1 Tax=Pedobacter antarcticus TaxID=34086 RepID=UPI00292E0481|nr:hypothetical protein [Pedobacter antarcticus]